MRGRSSTIEDYGGGSGNKKSSCQLTVTFDGRFSQRVDFSKINGNKYEFATIRNIRVINSVQMPARAFPDEYLLDSVSIFVGGSAAAETQVSRHYINNRQGQFLYRPSRIALFVPGEISPAVPFQYKDAFSVWQDGRFFRDNMNEVLDLFDSEQEEEGETKLVFSIRENPVLTFYTLLSRDDLENDTRQVLDAATDNRYPFASHFPFALNVRMNESGASSALSSQSFLSAAVNTNKLFSSLSVLINLDVY